MINLVDIIDRCKEQKEFFHNKKKEMPPLVIAYRENKPLAVILAPQLNKYHGLKAAQIVRVAMAADTIILMNDIYSYQSNTKTLEEAKKSWPDGLMQKAIAQGINTEGICEAINLSIINDKLQTHNIAVHYEIKNGKLQWTEPTKEAVEKWSKAKIVGGLIFESLQKIMKLQPTILTELAWAMGLTDPEKIRFHSDRAAVTALRSFGFTVHHTGDQL